MRVENIATTFVQELSPDYLFFNSADNYVVPVGTGAYLFYLLPLYFWGLYLLAKRPHPFYLLTWCVALVIAASAAKLSLYRNASGLYLSFIPIALGAHAVAKRSRPLLICFVLLALFMQVRFLTYYFKVYAKSDAFGWGSDAAFVAQYIGTHEDEYRTIIDKSAGDFGPLYYAFYNAYDPALFRTRAEWTTGDPAGWTHVGKLGKVVSADPRSLENLICEKAAAKDDDLSALYITAPLEDFSRFATLTTKNQLGDQVIHEFYDLDDLFAKLMADNPANLTRLCPRETSAWPKP